MIKGLGILALLNLMAFYGHAQDIDVLQYNILIMLNDKTDTVAGAAEIQLVQKNSSGVISLDLQSTNKAGRGMQVLSVLANNKKNSPLNVYQTLDKLIISESSVKQNDTVTINVIYLGAPADGLIISKNKYGDRTFFADNWPNRAHCWFPCHDNPADKASIRFSLRIPKEYNAVANGLMPFKSTSSNSYNGPIKDVIWEEATPIPTKVMVIGVARFATKTFADSPANIPVSAWVYPQDSAKGFYDYGIAPSIVKFFADYIGPFPYKKLANVQSKTIFGGMENASCIFYNEDYVTGDRKHEDVIAHEIAHQWFGDAVSEKSFAHLWLSEGFANYFENFYFEKKYGEEAARKKWEAAREEVIAFAKQSAHPVVDSTKDLMSLLNTNSYQKGAWVLRMLRFEVGDSVFQKIIQTYYQQYKHGNTETRDFEAVAEKVSGKELTWFFNQWLYQPSVPQLALNWKYEKGTILISSLGELSPQEFKVAIKLLIVYKDKTKQTVTMKESSHNKVVYKIPSKQKPLQIILDPATELLFDGKISEAK